jgi:heme/copper-type cytochrome/quinol oxidase subunit 2
VIAGLVSTRSEYDHLFSIYVPIAVGVFALIAVAVLLAVLIPAPATRARDALAREQPEGTCPVLPGCAAAFLLYVTFTAQHKVDTVANQQRPAVVVDVTGSKWEWTFTYRRWIWQAQRAGASASGALLSGDTGTSYIPRDPVR